MAETKALKPIKATRKQQAVIANLVADSSISTAKAMRMAGYGKSMLRHAERVTQSVGFIALAERLLPDSKLLDVASEGLSADKIQRYKGKEFKDPDYYARHLYLQTALKIRGLAQTTDTPLGDINIQIVNYKDTPIDKPDITV